MTIDHQDLKRPCIEFGVVRIDSAMVLCIHSAIIQLLLTRRGKTRMDTVGIVFEFYTAHL